MYKRLSQLFLSIIMLTGVIYTPVYAEEETASTEETTIEEEKESKETVEVQQEEYTENIVSTEKAVNSEDAEISEVEEKEVNEQIEKTYNTTVTDAGDFRYTVSNGEVTITGYIGESTEVIIPAEIDGNPVVSIGNEAFYAKTKLTSITIPDGVTSIGNQTFYNCSNLTSITIPESVTSIGDKAFGVCYSITSITIPDGVTSIGDQTFDNCSNLTSITIPESVTSIGAEAFRKCRNLTSITILASDISIGRSIFYEACSGIKTAGPIGSGADYEFGWTESIPSNAFSELSGLSSITIPDGVTSIGNQTFYNCSSLTSITIPDGVTSIGDQTFYNCSSLTSITIPDGVTAFGKYAFSGCSSLTSITIPDGVTAFGKYAFSGCSSLTSITIPDGVKSIEDGTFSYCKGLTSITIPNGVKTIGESAFQYCQNLTSITIPDGVTSIGDDAFRNCESLISITIPDGVKSIGEEAFTDCSSLSSITIPASVTSIGDRAFEKPAFRRCTGIKTAGPIGSGADYEFGWTESIPACAFFGFSSLTNITIPDGVTSIGWRAFEDCSSLSSIAIPASVTYIGEDAFKGCTGIETAGPIGSGADYEFGWMESIPGRAFYQCSSLTSITIPDGVTAIRYGTFYRCSSLTSITIPASVTSISERLAFAGCTKLNYIIFKGNAPSIYDSVFSNTMNIKAYYIDNGTWTEENMLNYGAENIEWIPYDGTDPFHTLVYYDGDTRKSETFFYNIEDCLDVGGTTYNPKLAHLLSALATSAYNHEGYDFELLTDNGLQEGEFPSNPLPITESLKNLGFNAVKGGDVEEWNYYSSAGDPNYDKNKVAFTIATKTMDDGTPLILITIRGSYGDLWKWESDWRSNATFSMQGQGLHEGFSAATNDLLIKLDNFIYERSINTQNAKFVITAHSRGGAVANLVEKTLIDKGYNKENIYGYNFACPDTARDYDGNWNPNGKYDSIFNINNVRDIVGVVPGCLFDGVLNIFSVQLGPIFWGKYGKTGFFAKDWDSVTESMIGGIDQHESTLYMQFMKGLPSFSTFKTWFDARAKLIANVAAEPFKFNGKFLGLFCPVDVEIIDADGVKVAEVKNGQPYYYNDTLGDVFILNAGDQNLIYINGRNDYFVRLTGTDEGEMTYGVWDALSDEGQENGQTFTEVSLAPDKVMVSIIDNDEGSDEVTLVVLNDESEVEKKIEPNGEEVAADDELKEEYAKWAVDTVQHVSGVTISEEEVAIGAGSTEQLTATIEPEDADNQNVTWTSDNEDVATVDENGKVTGKKPGTANITVTTEDGGYTDSCKVTVLFDDVTQPSQYYYDAVYWAVENNITQGMGPTTFNPGGFCKRYQFVLFLWRQAGCPEPTETEDPFTDVLNDPNKNVYEKAVLWAKEKNITTGTTPTTFAPYAPLTRGQVVTFLYRAEGEPEVSTTTNPFRDLDSSKYYYTPVLWAVENEITTGLNATQFGPTNTCTRGQTVLFMYRLFGKE